MFQNKMTAPVLAHRNGQKRAIAKKHNLIVSLLRGAVKTAAVTLGIYLLAAVAAQQRAYYEANREKVAAQQRAYREANREKVAEYNRRYYQKRKKAKQCAES